MNSEYSMSVIFRLVWDEHLTFNCFSPHSSMLWSCPQTANVSSSPPSLWGAYPPWFSAVSPVSSSPQASSAARITGLKARTAGPAFFWHVRWLWCQGFAHIGFWVAPVTNIFSIAIHRSSIGLVPSRPRGSALVPPWAHVLVLVSWSAPSAVANYISPCFAFFCAAWLASYASFDG